MQFKLAFIGFGVVGQGLTEILLEKKTCLQKNTILLTQLLQFLILSKARSMMNLDLTCKKFLILQNLGKN